jgi:hypothetical protein
MQQVHHVLLLLDRLLIHQLLEHLLLHLGGI